MTRVLHVVPNLHSYGLQNMVVGLVRSMDRTRYQPAVASLYAESEIGLEPELRAAGIRMFHLDKRAGFDIRMYGRLGRVLREFQPHLIHTHNYVLRYVYPLVAVRVKNAARFPRVVHTIHNLAEREVDGIGIRLQRFAFRHGVQAVTIAAEVSASFRRVYGFEEAATIPNGIPVARYQAPSVAREAWRARHGIASGDFVYLTVARFSEQKDHATLLEAFARGPARHPEARLLLAGAGELEDAIGARVRELGMRDRVLLIGQRRDIADVAAASDAFVLTSRWEGNPLSVMEAMAAGLPVVATRVGAIPELVRHGIDGILAPPGDIRAISQAMTCLLEHADKARAMGKRGRDRARERFDLNAMVRAYSALYRRVLGETGAHPAAEPGLVTAL
ncbi:MAG: glycosyltransferase [Bryobacteraceae bacterium]